MSVYQDRSGVSKPRHKSMSASVRKLQEALNLHLDVHEKTVFVDILNEFHITRNITVFTKNLKQLLDTPAKKQLFLLIRKVIPKTDVEAFDQSTRVGGRKYGTMPVKRTRKPVSSHKSPVATILPAKQQKQQKVKTRPRKDRDSSSSQSIRGPTSAKSVKSLKSAIKDKGNDVLRISMKQTDPEKGFGFSIRGGSEFGIGIYVSLVDPGGTAEREGLLPGDLLTEVNGVSFETVSHSDVVKLIRAARKLDITLCRVGRIPGSFVVHQMYKWIDGHGRPTTPPLELEQIGQLDTAGRRSGLMLLKGSDERKMYKWIEGDGGPTAPPLELEQIGQLNSAGSRSGLMLLKGSDERKVNVTVREGNSLGLMIRGGREFGLGIYISGIDSHSVAEEAGLKVGDQILDINGQSFLDISHAVAVRVLKTSSHMVFTIKDVGKLPYGRTTVDKTNWLPSKTSTPRSKTGSQDTDTSTLVSKRAAFRKGIGSQMMLNSEPQIEWDAIEKQARELLNDTEQATLRYYLSEYQKGYISVDGLTMASFELLNTKAKMTLMAEVRNLVNERDLDKFDTLLDRRTAQQKLGHLPDNYSTLSLDKGMKIWRGPDQHRSSSGSIKTNVSLPVSQSTLRGRSGRQRRSIAGSDLEPLRKAIEQIEGDPNFLVDFMPQDYQESFQLSRLKSLSAERLPTTKPHPTSFNPPRRSQSTEILTPVENPYHIPYHGRIPQQQKSNNAPHRPRNTSNTAWGSRSFDNWSHRQRSGSGSNSSTLRSRHQPAEDGRPASVRKTKPAPRIPIHDDTGTYTIHSTTSSKPLDDYDIADNVAFVEVHHPHRLADGIPSDDSGVDVNGNSHHDSQHLDRSYSSNFSMRQKRVTISPGNPVNIDDALHQRTPSIDLSSRDPYSVPRRPSTNHNTGASRRSSAMDNMFDIGQSKSPSSSPLPSPVRRSNFEIKPNIEILLNDGEGSIDTMSYSNFSSSQFFTPSQTNSRSQSQTRAKNNRQSSARLFDIDDDDVSIVSQDSIYDDEPQSFDVHSDMGRDCDLFVSPLDRVLDSEDYDIEARIISDAKKKYGDVPLEIISVYKTKPTLGMAIEGGANTRQPLPRVINLQPGGSAYESGGLKVGHVILEVNETSLIGLEHIVAAKTIAGAFKNKNNDHMELLVTDSNVTIKNHSVKPSEVEV